MEILQQIDWRVVLPIITFILGLSYSLIDKYWDRKRERDNLKTVLFYELSANHFMLTNAPKGELDVQSKVILAMLAQSLEYSIYEEYLGKISVLKPFELDVVLVAYNSIERLVEDGIEYMEYFHKYVVDREEEDVDKEIIDKLTESLQMSTQNTQNATSAAVAVFVKGREDLLKQVQALYPGLKS